MAQTDLVCSKCVGRRTVSNIMMKVNSKVMVTTVPPSRPLAYTRRPIFVSASVYVCMLCACKIIYLKSFAGVRIVLKPNNFIVPSIFSCFVKIYASLSSDLLRGNKINNLNGVHIACILLITFIISVPKFWFLVMMAVVDRREKIYILII
jgi:hypothetical protein